MSQPTPDDLIRHPPERGRRPGVVLPQFACCCCCCCCLHTVGGLIGAVVGSTETLKPEPKPVEPDFPFPYRRDEPENEPELLPVTAIYWLLVLFGITFWGGGTFLWMPRGPRGFFESVAVAIFFLPVVQLAASTVTVAFVLALSNDRVNALYRLGRISLWSFVGAAAGTLMMVGCCGLGAIGFR